MDAVALARRLHQPERRMFPIRIAILLLLATNCSASASEPAPATEHDHFVGPGRGVPEDRPVWGHRDGVRIGLAPAPGPHGLIRIYAPYLGQAYPRMVNFLSIEPTVRGQAGRDQSELAMSRDRPGERGLTFRPSNHLAKVAPAKSLPAGVLAPGAGIFRLFVHPERFPNGAKPILEIEFHRDRPHEIGIVIHAAPDSAPMESCVISATMGNYGLLRRLHLDAGRIEQAPELWNDEPLDALEFLPWRSWPAEALERTSDGRFVVRMDSDQAAPAAAPYEANVPPRWRYEGVGAIHFWRADSGARPTVAVNARRTYWQTDAIIPGGAAFENFELRLPFQEGQRLWFGVEPSE